MGTSALCSITAASQDEAAVNADPAAPAAPTEAAILPLSVRLREALVALSEDAASPDHRAQLDAAGLGKVRPDNALSVLETLAQGEAALAQQRYQDSLPANPHEELAAQCALARRRILTALVVLERLEHELRHGGQRDDVCEGRAIAIGDRLTGEAGRILEIAVALGGDR